MRRAAATGKRSITARICRMVASMMYVVPGLLGAACASAPRSETAARVPDIGPTRCDSLPSPVDTTVETVYITVEAPLRKEPLSAQYADELLGAFRDAFVAPRVANVPVFSTGAADSSRMMPSVFGEVELLLDSSGALSEVRLTQSSMSAALDRAILDAPHRADSLHRLPDAGAVGGITEPLFIVLHAARPARGLWEPLFQVRVPEWSEGHDAARITRGTATPSYPEAGLNRGLGDTVVFEFVIDAGGHPVASTVRIVSAHYREFARAAMSGLMHTRFRPASIRGCAVQQLVMLPWAFMVAR